MTTPSGKTLMKVATVTELKVEEGKEKETTLRRHWRLLQ
jgi:hypothetical protein